MGETVVDGVYRGVFTSTEQRDEQFLRNRDLFGEGNTWLYKVDGGTTLEFGPGDSPTFNHLSFAPFKERHGTTPPDFDIDLPQWIDMESMMALAACEAFVENNDGLVLARWRTKRTSAKRRKMSPNIGPEYS